MKKLCIILSALFISSASFSSLAFADHDPVMCHVEINYDGHDYGGHEDGMNETEATIEAKAEACERACRFGGDACEQDCMTRAVMKNQDCKENPKAHKDYAKSDSFFCRALINYDGKEIEGSDSAQNVDKAGRDAYDEACDEICDDRADEKKCERDCRINAEIIGLECTDRDNKVVEMHGKIPHHHVIGAPAEVPAAPANNVHPMDKFKADQNAEKEAAKAEKEAAKADKKDDKKADKKDDKKADKKDDKKADKKDNKKAGKK